MQMSMTKYKILQHSEEENADEEFDFRPAVGEEDHGEQFISRWLWNLHVVKKKGVSYCFCAHLTPTLKVTLSLKMFEFASSEGVAVIACERHKKIARFCEQ